MRTSSTHGRGRRAVTGIEKLLDRLVENMCMSLVFKVLNVGTLRPNLPPFRRIRAYRFQREGYYVRLIALVGRAQAERAEMAR